jgi:hypothetical protein
LRGTPNGSMGRLEWNAKFDRQGFALPIKINSDNQFFAELLCSGQK